MGRNKPPAEHFDTSEVDGRCRKALAVYDELEETLMVIKMQLKSAIRAQAGLRSPEDNRPNRGLAQADRAGLSIRQISAELGSVLLDTLGLAATIEWYVHELRKCTSAYYELNIEDAVGAGLAEEYASAIFHVFHEALSNIALHAKAEKIAIKVNITPQEVALVVWDDGVGIAEMQASNSNSGGLAKMRKYASSLKGSCHVVGVPDKGTTLSVCLPL